MGKSLESKRYDIERYTKAIARQTACLRASKAKPATSEKWQRVQVLRLETEILHLKAMRAYRRYCLYSDRRTARGKNRKAARNWLKLYADRIKQATNRQKLYADAITFL